MDQHKAWWIEERMKKAVEKLESHDFDGLYVKSKEGAAEEILKYVTPETRIGAAGSVTIRELRILEELKARGNMVYDHWVPGLSKEESLRIRKSQMTCDLFLGSANAVTMHGELVNIDAAGNRTNSMVFGPGRVIFVAGYNKLVEDVQEAIKRIKEVAAPVNARRLNMDVPCAKTGKCVDCNAPQRICRVIVIHERKPILIDMLVILVGEELGY